ncbi:MAG TPA: CHAD domain-containing protein [Candidatus Binataceae bacterium]|nr:CHAD domain-containing protein [Candidatus Binataceae bacterium]
MNPGSSRDAQAALARPPQLLLAPGAAAADATAGALAAGAAALRFYEPLARAGDVEAIHQFRVSVRRLRAAVDLLAPLVHGSRLRFYRRELPLLGRAAGAVRDCDALAELIHTNSAALEPQIARGLVPAYQALADRRVAALRALNAFVDSKRYRILLARLAPTLTRTLPASATVLTRAPILLRPVARAAERAGVRLAADSPPTVFHNLRTRLKRMRYAVEMLEPMAGKRTAKTLKKLRALQEELGELQDLVTTSAWLRDFVSGAALPPETLIATGALMQYLNQRRAQVAVHAFRRWKKFAHSAGLSKAMSEIGALARLRHDAASNGAPPRADPIPPPKST